jgi:[ribosomal protein S5]-alanine N-acetyltransferase
MEHKGSIILETERLILRPLVEKDAKEMFNNWASDDEVSKYVRWSTHKNIEETREYLRQEEKDCKNKDHYNWGIVLKESGILIGAIGAILDEDGRYETGYNISKKYWRNGYTTEALKRIIEYLSKDVGIKKFRCIHAVLNPASGAVMKKAGFKYVKDDYYEKFDKSIGYESKVYYLDIK